jgi:SAM-dependent methyltransferase/methyltransferase-like protein
MTTYDENPYPSLFHPSTNPARIGAIVAAMGLVPPPVAGARILDIGCGDGLNALAIGTAFPGAKIDAFDLSSVQIARGVSLRERAGIENVALFACGIDDFPDLGHRYDYIIAHGLFSWVSEAVGADLLRLIHDRLAPGGVAIISHDTPPLGIMKASLIEYLLAFADGITDPKQRLHTTRVGLAKLMQAQAGDSPYKYFLQMMQSLYGWSDDSFVSHDLLSEDYRCVSPMQLEQECSRFRLKLIGDCQMASVFEESGNQLWRDVVEQMGSSSVNRAIAVDHLGGRMFRTSLITHRAHPPMQSGNSSRLTGLYFSSNAGAEIETDPETGTERVTYNGENGSKLSAHEPVIVQIIEFVREAFPNEVTLEEVASHLGIPVDVAEAGLKRALVASVVTAFSEPLPKSSRAPLCAKISDLARHLALMECEDIPTRRLEIATLSDPGARWLVSNMDGHHTAQELRDLMSEYRQEPIALDRIHEAIERAYELNLLEG